MTTLRLGGVPEYFNLPIHQAIAHGDFDRAGIKVEWVNVPEGTGAMSRMLWEGELDMAIILTEGITKSIIDGNPSRIIKNYVDSPLLWGVHVPYANEATPLTNISKHKIAISRYGSGSHLMSFVMAQNNRWNAKDLHFEVVNNLKGAIDSFASGESDVFLWEKYTTKPLVDNQTFSRVGIVETPWPCFVMAAGLESLEANKDEIKSACKIINTLCKDTQNNPDLASLISTKFGLKEEDADQIVKEVKWSKKLIVDQDAIQKVVNTLQSLKLINKSASVADLIYEFN